MAGWSWLANPVSAQLTLTAYGFAQQYGFPAVNY
jgi:hypothetical protein